MNDVRLDDAPAHLRPYARAPDDALADFLEASVARARDAGDSTARRITASNTFALVCPCGEAALLLGVAYNWDVVDLACGACGREASLFDPTAHGRGRAELSRPPFETVPYGCMCRMMLFAPAVLLGYDARAQGPLDFVWVAVGGRCVACGEHNLALDVDCR